MTKKMNQMTDAELIEIASTAKRTVAHRAKMILAERRIKALIASRN